MPIASQANSHAIGSIGVRILCSDVTILFVIRMRSPIPAFRHPPNLRLPESSLTLVVQRKLYHIRTLLPRKLYHRVHGAKVFNFSKSNCSFSWTLLFYHKPKVPTTVKSAEIFVNVGVNI